jgi:hypothetical protein
MAEWAGTAGNAHLRRVYLTFDTTDGQQVRLHLGLESARALVETLADALPRFQSLSQWSSDSGMSSNEGSPHDGQNVWPLASS